MPSLPSDYPERVYAGVLGKLIGVYLGRPFEQWSHEAIARRWGEIRRYVHEDQGVPLIVADDDITGTFTFIRALIDRGCDPGLSSRQIGETWLNYIAENRHILWWGGMGRSTEHTAFLRLKAGVSAPESGSIALNGKAVAEEIGAQIFIDGWALVSPGQPEQAARLAREAARVSHDGEAVHGAVALAVMEALAFEERDIDALLDRAAAFIPGDCEIARLTSDLRRWSRADGDWRRTLGRLLEAYGYERYGTGCPMVSNHGVILLGLLYGEGDFDRSMMIVNTAGYDTDCNSGNLGCLLGIRNGLGTFRSGYDWRTPVNDRLFLPAADGHWGMMDAANLALRLAELGRRLAGASKSPSAGRPRYAFPFDGCSHGFAPSSLCPLEAVAAPVADGLRLETIDGDLRADAEVAAFLTPDRLSSSGGYAMAATPTLYGGQEIVAVVEAACANAVSVGARLFIRRYGAGEGGAALGLEEGPEVAAAPGETVELRWRTPEGDKAPIATAGVRLSGPGGSALVLREMSWGGTPRLALARPPSLPERRGAGDPWLQSFIADVDAFSGGPDGVVELVRNRGRGIVHTGSADWTDLTLGGVLQPFLAAEFGLAIRVAGLRRYWALLLTPEGGGRARLVRVRHGEEIELAAADCPWRPRDVLEASLSVRGNRLAARVGEAVLLEADDPEAGFPGGGVGLVLAEGRLKGRGLGVEPLKQDQRE